MAFMYLVMENYLKVLEKSWKIWSENLYEPCRIDLIQF